MGVTSLWQALETAREEKSLDDLKGKTLAVDVSQWLCECDASAINCDPDTLPKMYLRNTFFRTIHLLKAGIRPIFIFDGNVTELKFAEMARRLNIATFKSTERPRLQESGKECRQLFDLMGLLSFQSSGEAEALCAYLDNEGLVDGCLTNDGDALLYGARTVYRGYSITAKKIGCYQMEAVKNNMSISRDGLIAMATLTGCDYNNKGAQGVGISRFTKFLLSCTSFDLNPIEVLRQWLCSSEVPNERPLCRSDNQMAKLSEKIRQSLTLEDFEKVVAEFLNGAANCSQNADYDKRIVALKEAGCLWRLPKLSQVVAFCDRYFNWSRQYAKQHLYPLMARYRLTEGAYLQTKQQNSLPYAKAIVRRKIQNSQDSFEVHWTWAINLELTGNEDDFVTTEPAQLFKLVYPQMTEEFESAEKKQMIERKNKKSPRKLKPSDSNGTQKLESIWSSVKKSKIHP